MSTLCRTKRGTLRVVHEGVEYVLDESGLELPDEIAETIRPHANVLVGFDDPTPEPAPEPASDPAPEPDRKKNRG